MYSPQFIMTWLCCEQGITKACNWFEANYDKARKGH